MNNTGTREDMEKEICLIHLVITHKLANTVATAFDKFLSDTDVDNILTKLKTIKRSLK